jgi:hypothetical protein
MRQIKAFHCPLLRPRQPRQQQGKGRVYAKWGLTPRSTPTRYGRRCKPGNRYGVHFLLPGLHRLPPRSALTRTLGRTKTSAAVVRQETAARFARRELKQPQVRHSRVQVSGRATSTCHGSARRPRKSRADGASKPTRQRSAATPTGLSVRRKEVSSSACRRRNSLGSTQLGQRRQGTTASSACCSRSRFGTSSQGTTFASRVPSRLPSAA